MGQAIPKNDAKVDNQICKQSIFWKKVRKKLEGRSLKQTASRKKFWNPYIPNYYYFYSFTNLSVYESK